MITTTTRQKLAKLEAMFRALPPGKARNTVASSITTLKTLLASEMQSKLASPAAPVLNASKPGRAPHPAWQQEVERLADQGHFYQAMAELTGSVTQFDTDYNLELLSPLGTTLRINRASKRGDSGGILTKYVGQVVAVRGYPTILERGIVRGIKFVWVGDMPPESRGHQVEFAGLVGPDQRQVWVFRNASAPNAERFNHYWRYNINWSGLEAPTSAHWVRLRGRLGDGAISVESIVAQSWARPLYLQPRGFKPWWSKRQK